VSDGSESGITRQCEGAEEAAEITNGGLEHGELGAVGKELSLSAMRVVRVVRMVR
jgi:hypothetical protein